MNLLKTHCYNKILQHKKTDFRHKPTAWRSVSVRLQWRWFWYQRVMWWPWPSPSVSASRSWSVTSLLSSEFLLMCCRSLWTVRWIHPSLILVRQIKHQRWSLQNTHCVSSIFLTWVLYLHAYFHHSGSVSPRVRLFVDVSAGLSAGFHKTTSQIPIKPRIGHDADSDKGMDPGTFSHFL